MPADIPKVQDIQELAADQTLTGLSQLDDLVQPLELDLLPLLKTDVKFLPRRLDMQIAQVRFLAESGHEPPLGDSLSHSTQPLLPASHDRPPACGGSEGLRQSEERRQNNLAQPELKMSEMYGRIWRRVP
eukprot:753419-Hanusia_phi.AAC.2